MAFTMVVVECPICRHGKATLDLDDYAWECLRCRASGHFTIKMTAHALRPRRVAA